MESRVCNFCKINKSLSEFYDNYKTKCKVCKKEYEKNYRQVNREKCNKDRRLYKAKRLKEDSLYALKNSLRKLINESLKRQGYSKKTKAYKYLGASYETVHAHLMNSFVERYGRNPLKDDDLHIDHIKPCALSKNEEEMIALQHYTNLQWLLAKDNRDKGMKYEVD